MSEQYDYTQFQPSQQPVFSQVKSEPMQEVTYTGAKHPATPPPQKDKKPRKTSGKIGTKTERLKYSDFLASIKNDSYEKIILDLITERNILNKRISNIKNVNEALEREFLEFRTCLFTKRLENMEVEIN